MAVSEKEYLDFHTRQAESDQIDDTLAQAAREHPAGPPSPAPGRRNLKGQRRGQTHAPAGSTQPVSFGQGAEREAEWERLEHGEDHGVPRYPDPLPLAHTYAYLGEGQQPAQGHAPLDVGAAKPYFWGDMAHGVDGPVRYGGRPQPTPEQRRAHEASAAPLPFEPRQRFDPVPVYIVSEASGNRPMIRTVLQRRAVPATGQAPAPMVGKDPKRTSVRILNESATPIRLMTEPTNPGGAATTQDAGNGIILPATMTSYLEIKTQDQLWAVADSGAVILYVSIISEYSVPGGA